MAEQLYEVHHGWCDCGDRQMADRDPDSVVGHELTCLYGGEVKRVHLRGRCRCWDPPLSAQGPLTLNEHDETCGFPVHQCENDDHRIWIHRACGRPVSMRFCGCSGSDHGYTFDRASGWWVHYVCGWPTRTWFERNGQLRLLELEGVKPITYHEYKPVPKSPSRPYEALSDEQRRWNERAVGRWVWD
jgi:hypothetical protein